MPPSGRAVRRVEKPGAHGVTTGGPGKLDQRARPREGADKGAALCDAPDEPDAAPVSGATVNDIKADAALMGRLEALTLGIGAPDVLDALTGLLQAATALVRLDLRGHSPPTRPLSAAAMSHCAALRRTLVAATRVTHLGLRTTCLDLPCAVELPRLRSLHIDEAVCSSGQRMGVPLSHALRCPQAEAVDVLLRACKRCYYCQ